MQNEKLKKLEALISLADQDYASADEIAEVLSAVISVMEELRVQIEEAQGESASLSSSIAAVSGRMREIADAVESQSSAIETVDRRRRRMNRRLIEEVNSIVFGLQAELSAQIAEIPKPETMEDILSNIRGSLAVADLPGSSDMVSRKEMETALVEIGGKLTVLEKRSARGYGDLGGGSEGTGSLFISRMRDVKLSSLQDGQTLVWNAAEKRWRNGAASSGNISGSGTEGQITFWDGDDSITGVAGFEWDNSTKRLTVNDNASGGIGGISLESTPVGGDSIPQVQWDGTDLGIRATQTASGTHLDIITPAADPHTRFLANGLTITGGSFGTALGTLTVNPKSTSVPTIAVTGNNNLGYGGISATLADATARAYYAKYALGGTDVGGVRWGGQGGFGTFSALNMLTVKAMADFSSLGTTTANATTSVTGSGTRFLEEVGIGDRISLNSGVSFAYVKSVASQTALTAASSIGSGGTQNILVRKALQGWIDSSGSVKAVLDDRGILHIGDGSADGFYNIASTNDLAYLYGTTPNVRMQSTGAAYALAGMDIGFGFSGTQAGFIINEADCYLGARGNGKGIEFLVGPNGTMLLESHNGGTKTEYGRFTLTYGLFGMGTTTGLAKITAKSNAEFTATGTTSASSATTITGSGTSFTTEIAPGDRISLSDAATTYSTVLSVASNTSLTVDRPLGSGGTQTINVRKAGFLGYDSSGTGRFWAQDTGSVKVAGFQAAYAAKTGAYSVTFDDHTIDCTSGSFTVTLPDASNHNRIFVVKNSGAGTITLATTSSQTIDGLSTQSIAAGVSYTVQSTGANWIII